MGDANTDVDGDGDGESDRTEHLTSVYLSVTGGDAESTVERQREVPSTREIRGEPTETVVGPAELHGLADAIDDPDPSNA